MRYYLLFIIVIIVLFCLFVCLFFIIYYLLLLLLFCFVCLFYYLLFIIIYVLLVVSPQHSDLEDCILFEWQSLRKHVTAYPFERLAPYPLLGRLHHLSISEKAYIVGQTFRLFLRSHHRALKIMNKHINVPEVASVSAAAKAQLAVVEAEMYEVYQDTLRHIPQLFPIMRDFYFMQVWVRVRVRIRVPFLGQFQCPGCPWRGPSALGPSQMMNKHL